LPRLTCPKNDTIIKLRIDKIKWRGRETNSMKKKGRGKGRKREEQMVNRKQ
jgi:hypothetical protein